MKRKLNSSKLDSASESSANIKVLGSGMILLKKVLTDEEQLSVLNAIAPFTSMFYNCATEKTKDVNMLTMGVDTSGRQNGPKVPAELTSLCSRFLSEAKEALGYGSGAGQLPNMAVDQCVVNLYRASSILRLHEDVRSTADPRIAVVSISIGASAKFIWKRSWRKTDSMRSVDLESGDVLVFGGK